MPSYSVEFVNDTDRARTMAVYVSQHSIGFESVSWRQGTAPQGGRITVEFDLSLSVLLGSLHCPDPHIFRESQILESNLGAVWDIVFGDGVQQLKLAGRDNPSEIIVRNNSGYPATPGIGFSGRGAVYKDSLVSGAAVQFEAANPAFYVGVFDNIERGEVISNDNIVPSQHLVYPFQSTRAKLTARLNAASVVLDLAYE